MLHQSGGRPEAPDVKKLGEIEEFQCGQVLAKELRADRNSGGISAVCTARDKGPICSADPGGSC